MSRAFRESGLPLEAAARFNDVDCSGEPMLTTQADRNEVDINRIVARVMKGQSIPMRNDQPFYGDVSDLGGLQEAFMAVQEADELFMQYPAEVRERFNNDPVELVEFLGDERNYDEALKLGLVNERPKLAPPEPPPAAPPA